MPPPALGNPVDVDPDDGCFLDDEMSQVADGQETPHGERAERLAANVATAAEAAEAAEIAEAVVVVADVAGAARDVGILESKATGVTNQCCGVRVVVAAIDASVAPYTMDLWNVWTAVMVDLEPGEVAVVEEITATMIGHTPLIDGGSSPLALDTLVVHTWSAEVQLASCFQSP